MSTRNVAVFVQASSKDTENALPNRCSLWPLLTVQRWTCSGRGQHIGPHLPPSRIERCAGSDCECCSVILYRCHGEKANVFIPLLIVLASVHRPEMDLLRPVPERWPRTFVVVLTLSEGGRSSRDGQV